MSNVIAERARRPGKQHEFNQLLLAVGRRVKSQRESKKLSQEELAFRAEIDTTYLSKIERGITNPTYLVMTAIAKALDVHVKDLLI